MATMPRGKVSLNERNRIADEIDANCRWEGRMLGVGCQIWQGPTDQEGYAVREFHGKQWRVGELRYYVFRGEKPFGMVLHHRCRNKLCCCFVHLSLVSPHY